jgi:hypothetical protein
MYAAILSLCDAANVIRMFQVSQKINHSWTGPEVIIT